MTNFVKLECKGGDGDSLQNNSSTTKTCLTNPVEVEVTKLHEFLYEKDTIKSTIPNTKEKKPGLWKTIFGEKKCKSCSKTKHDCICKDKKRKHKSVEKNHNQKGKCEETAAVLNCSAYGTSREVQKTGNCPTKCSLPMTQGCGCHLYFCIDSKRKKQSLKNKKHKNKQNEEIKTEGKLPLCANMECDYLCNECVPHVTLFCDQSNDLEKSQSSEKIKNNDSPKHNSDNDHSEGSSETKRFNFSSSNKTVFQFQSHSNRNIFRHDLNKPITEEINTIAINNDTSPKPISIGKNSDKIVYHGNVKGNNILKQSSGINIMHKEDNLLNMNKADKETTSVKGSDSLSNNGTKQLEKTVSIISVNTEKSRKNLQKDKIPKLQNTPANTATDSDNETIVEKEYSNFDFSRKRTRKSTARSLFVRNSLITLRRERRQSEFEGRVSLILEKLENIESKITELEKVNAEEKEKNISMGMGITCDGKRSKILVKFDNQPGKKALGNNKTLVNISPSREKSHKTIRIRSNNEEIYLNAPKEVDIVKSKQPEDLSNRSKQVIYENSYEMDVHTIGSNSATVQCNNPKIVVSCKKPEVLCKSPNCPWKWRRISEELKKSNLNFDKCDTCGQKK